MKKFQPMNYDMGHLLVLRVMNATMSRSWSSISWKYTETYGEQSFVCLLQIYNDKSKTTTKRSGLTFYALHFTMLNRTEQCRRKQIVMENTVLVYLTTVYSLPDESNRPEVHQQVPFRFKVLKALHECTEEAFEPNQRYSLKMLSMRTKYDAELRCRFAISL